MFDQLLPTKLYMPPVRPDHVARPRLRQQLNPSPQTRLILISAPAGYGKTTLVSDWLQSANRPTVCWVALSEAESDPQLFFRYVAAALTPLIGEQGRLIRYLQAGQTPTATLAQALISDVAAVPHDFLLVLDDYHTIDSADIDQALASILDFAPPQLTIVITSRSDPGFPLSRLRARGQLIEIRAEALRFSAEETAAFLQRTMGLSLDAAQIAALEQRTEGWIAGLQMAALSLQDRPPADRHAFVEQFTGSHRFVLDYLMEEALAKQPPAMRSFLLATSILERLTADLCQAVTGLADSQARLTQLERDNLFLIPLDDERRWYRYHHLFADVLQTHARTHAADQINGWHQRAGRWLAANHDPQAAIRHAMAAADFELAAALLEQIRPSIDGIRPVAAWVERVGHLPEAILADRPVLLGWYGWALIEVGRIPDGLARLQAAEAWLTRPMDEWVVADPAYGAVLSAMILNARAYHALIEGDPASAVDFARQALASMAVPHFYWQRVALSLQGVASWMAGDVPAAADAFAAMYDLMARSDEATDALGVAYALAEMQIIMGLLNEADRTIERALTLARDLDQPRPLGSSDLWRVKAELACERGDFERAQELLDQAIALGEEAALTNWYHRLRLTQGRIARHQGDLPAALALLDEAQRLYVENPMPAAQPAAARKATLWIDQGALGEAWRWVEEAGLAAEDALSYVREYEHLVLARLLLSGDSHQQQAGLTLLDRLLKAAVAGSRLGTALEIMVVQAVGLANAGDEPAARHKLLDALKLAEPQRQFAPFIEAGESLIRLLTQLPADHPIQPAFLEALHNALTPAGQQPLSANERLPDPLSERELEILTLIAAGLKNKEIAAELIISLNTVLYHTKNIYGKLGVNKRALAIAKARELALIR